MIVVGRNGQNEIVSVLESSLPTFNFTLSRHLNALNVHRNWHSEKHAERFLVEHVYIHIPHQMCIAMLTQEVHDKYLAVKHGKTLTIT